MRGNSDRSSRPTLTKLAVIAPVVVLGTLLALAFQGALSGDLFYLRDISQNHQPIRDLVAERMQSGSLPLWDPYHGGGTPLLANPNNLVLHPISLLFLLIPVDTAFSLSIVLQFALLAGGGYLLARRLGAGRAGATLAAVVMSLSGPAASLASMQNVLSAAAWVPIALWAWLTGLEPGRRWCLALSAVLTSVILIAAEPASLVAFLLLAVVLGTTAQRASGFRPDSPRVLFLLVPVVLVAAAIAAAQILPARDLLSVATRGAGFTGPEGLKWSMQPFRILEILAPGPFGDPTRLDPSAWWGHWFFEGGYPFLLSVYIGAIPCLLALYVLVSADSGREARYRLIAAVGILGLLLALGRHAALYRFLFAAVPGADQVRYPERFLLITMFAVALLAARGLDDLFGRERSAARVSLFITAGAVAFVGVTLIATPALANGLLGVAMSVPVAKLGAETAAIQRGALMQSALWVFFEIALLAVAVVISRRMFAGRQVAATASAWGIVALSGFSMLLATTPTRSTADPGWLTAPSPLEHFVEHGPGAPRLHHGPRPAGLSIWGKTDELIWGFRFDRFTYSLASGHRDRVPTILDPATDRMDLREGADLGRVLNRFSPEERVRILRACRGGYLLTYEEIDHPDLIPGPDLGGFSRPPARIYRVGGVPARARFVDTAVRPRFENDLARSLADPGFDAGRSVILEEDGITRDAQPVAHAGIPGTVEIVEEKPERLRMIVEARTPGYLVLDDAFAPGWSATVDGIRADILRANGLFRAVRLDPGRHDVEMIYDPWSVSAGLWVSLVGIIGAVGWGLGARRAVHS